VAVAAVDVPCPHCGMEPGRPCWRRWDLHGSLLAEVATPGYCQARAELARDTPGPDVTVP
jgi:hypothetical protein